MSDKRVERFRKAYKQRKPIMPKTAREMLEAYYASEEQNKGLLATMDELKLQRDAAHEDAARLRHERDIARGELEDYQAFMTEIRRITGAMNGSAEPPFADDAVRTAIANAVKFGGNREREAIAQHFDDLYPSWADTIRCLDPQPITTREDRSYEITSSDDLFSRIDKRTSDDDPDKKEPGSLCLRCGRRFKVDLNLPNQLWAEIHGGYTILCPVCIGELLEERGRFDAIHTIKTETAARWGGG